MLLEIDLGEGGRGFYTQFDIPRHHRVHSEAIARYQGREVDVVNKDKHST